MAAAVGLGVDIVVAGISRAAALAGVIVGFCEIGALLLALAAWVAERRERPARGLPPAHGPTGQEDAAAGPAVTSPKFVVDAGQAGVVQIGDHGIQHVHARSEPGRPDGC